jgi:CRP/FNR family nitrogen fixation transcriptional regulator
MQSFAFQTAKTSPREAAMAAVLPFERPLAGGDATGVRMSFDRDEEIFGEGEATGHVYRVLTGAVRTYRVLSDGRRQIVEFHIAGDLFGLDGDLQHTLSAEAVTDSSLQVVRRSTFLNDPAGQATAMAVMMKKFQRAQEHMLLLGRHTACERVSAFLLDFQRRTGDAVVDLPMSRQDMADYLGLTIETVSRTMTQLQGSGLIDLVSCRKIALRNVPALDRICQ